MKSGDDAEYVEYWRIVKNEFAESRVSLSVVKEKEMPNKSYAIVGLVGRLLMLISVIWMVKSDIAMNSGDICKAISHSKKFLFLAVVGLALKLIRGFWRRLTQPAPDALQLADLEGFFKPEVLSTSQSLSTPT